MEVVGLALAVTTVGEPLIKAVRGLRKLCHVADDAARGLARLEQNARTICLYLDKIDEATGQAPAEFPQDFMEWLEDEKKLLQDWVAQIERYTKTAQQRLQTSALLGGVAYALGENEIAEIQ